MPKKKITNTVVEDEKATENEAEAMTRHSQEASVDASAINMDEEAEKALIAEEAADTDQAVPAEVAAIHTDNESARELNEKPISKKAAKANEKAEAKKSTRGKKYQDAKAMVEHGKFYSLTDAVELIKKTSFSKFDGSVEIHLRLTAKKTKGSTESSRGLFNLPHGTGKDKKVIVLTEEKIDEIAKTKKIDFDVAIATPALMPKVARIAKILGPKGKMPDPKSGTVTDTPEKAIAEINSGKAEYRIDSTNNIHQMIGRVSWETNKLEENAQTVLGGFPKARIAAAYVTASMSPSVALDLSTLK